MLKSKIRYIHIVVLLSIILSSCVTTRRTNFLQEPGAFIPSFEVADSVPDYRLQVGDELSIRIFSLDPEANEVFNLGRGATQLAATQGRGIFTYTIYPDGTINFPIVGAVHVAGKTEREVGVHLREILAGEFIVNEFSVVVTLVNNTFSLIRNRGTSGTFPIRGNRMNIFQAIAVAGDFDAFADRARVKVIRKAPEGTIIKEFDIRSRDILDSEFYFVRPNDVIYVQSFRGQFFRLNNFLTVLTTITSTITLGFFIWNITGGR